MPRRSRGFTVALIGPDGAGKTTVARRIERLFAARVKYIYMGVNPEASMLRLPTTRLVHRVRQLRRSRNSNEAVGHEAADAEATSGRRRKAFRVVWTALALGNRLAEEWYIYFIAWSYVSRGKVVMFDRHFYADYYAYDVSTELPRTLERRIHGFVLHHLYPKPDLLIYLDAPAEVLFDRKGEGTLEFLERRRRDYAVVVGLARRSAVVDASRPLDAVTDDVAKLIETFPAAGTATVGGAT
jgi:thymidylate kinase